MLAGIESSTSIPYGVVIDQADKLYIPLKNWVLQPRLQNQHFFVLKAFGFPPLFVVWFLVYEEHGTYADGPMTWEPINLGGSQLIQSFPTLQTVRPPRP